MLFIAGTSDISLSVKTSKFTRTTTFPVLVLILLSNMLSNSRVMLLNYNGKALFVYILLKNVYQGFHALLQLCMDMGYFI